MAKITRRTGNVEAFSSSAPGAERKIFGLETQSDTIDDNVSADWATGWGFVGTNEFPKLEHFNALGFTLGQYIAYLHQMGVPEWDGAQEYQIGSISNRLGVLYSCQTADHVSATPPESDISNWLLTSSFGAVGSIIPMSGDVNPAPLSYIKPTGASLSRSAYPELWAYAQTITNLIAQATKDSDTLLYSGFYGDGDGTTTFTIPDYRGLHYRSWDDGRGVDSSRAIGSYQADQLGDHTHSDVLVQSGSSIQVSRGSIDPASLSGENRVKTVAVMSLLKFR